MKYVMQGLHPTTELVLRGNDALQEEGEQEIFAVSMDWDAEEVGHGPPREILYIPVNEFYQFMENIKGWTYDTRPNKKLEEKDVLVDHKTLQKIVMEQTLIVNSLHNTVQKLLLAFDNVLMNKELLESLLAYNGVIKLDLDGK